MRKDDRLAESVTKGKKNNLLSFLWGKKKKEGESFPPCREGGMR